MDSQIHAILWVIMMKGVRKAMEQLHYNYSRKNINIETGSVCLPHRLLSLQLASGSGISACAEGRNRGMLRERKSDPSGGRPDSDQFKQRSRNIFKGVGEHRHGASCKSGVFKGLL